MATEWKLLYFYENDIEAADFPVLNRDEIHIWYLSISKSALSGQADILSAQEQERAQRYKHPGARQCYQIGHTALRLLLARYLDTCASALAFSCNEHNKPVLADESGFHFNISHSGDWIVLAFAQDTPVGVDIEYASDTRRTDLIVKRFFHPQEAGIYCTLSGEQRRTFFYEHWTAREAALKALGIGLTVETAFLVLAGGNSDGQSLRVAGGPAGSERLILYTMSCPQGYVGCAAGMLPEGSPAPQG